MIKVKFTPFFLLFPLLLALLSSLSLAASPQRTTDLDFAGADLRDVFRALAAQFQVDIVVADDVQDKVTLHFSHVTLQQAFDILRDTYQLDIQLVNNVYRVGKFYGERCDIQFKDGLVTLDAHAVPYSTLLTKLRDECRANIVFPENAKRVSLTLYNIPLADALETLAKLGGYTLDDRNGVKSFRTAADNAANLVVRWQNNLLSIEAQNAPLSVLAKEVTQRTGVSLVPDNTLQANISVYFHDLPLEDGLQALAAANGLRLTEESPSLYRLTKGGNGGRFKVGYQDGRLSVDASGIEITQILDEIARDAKVNIVPDQDVRGPVTVRFDGLMLTTGLATMLEANGYNLETQNALYLVHKKNAQQGVKIVYDPDTKLFNIEIANNATLAAILSQIAQKAGVNLVVYANVNAPLNNVFLHNITLDQALDLLLRGTSFIYKKQGETILVGDGANLRIDNDLLINQVFYLAYVQAENVLNALPPNFPRQYFIVLKEQNALAVSGSPEFIAQIQEYLKDLDQPKNQIHTEVIRVKNMKAEDILKLFPASLPKTDVMVIKEGNAIAVTGTQATIDRVKAYIAQVDLVNPMILFDVMVIQIKSVDDKEWGLKGIHDKNSGTAIELNHAFNYDGSTLTGNILIPGSNESKQFMATLQASISNNKAKVWASPQITALNGSTANFSVTTTDRYSVPINKTDSEGHPYTDYQTVNIDSGIQISFVPWVSAENDITIEIKPKITESFQSTQKSATEVALPSTTQRSVETTVRVRDNETIIIGGLRQKNHNNSVTKVPLLGDIPFIGNLFRYTTNDDTENEFIIVITPRLLSSAEASRQATEEAVQNYSESVREETPAGKKEEPVTGEDKEN